ncbi:ComEA family DNA-binding protein [Gordonia alkanivorans]|uniref:ComEA family DNA-binding protein n=2 Tax=Gordonia alkanivorans TaxID=84096 RepID=UPI000587E168|nr:ComEA family DNA-binding protein [Gordonia alkanivorans]MDH3008485.1 ComEA family DNA-binding protein [Gordonia alkanivorans]MDH3015585.1 ComEA family DNA-binding protein [Gordonia alkanivorans]MDH3020320.1 ComEA family DNA-binding protein [Gordonia alkanivorans]MDH3040267.1 ComEA family DNA-binding protein [Gordonia alkanivorans]MDH3048933.1 ComEA family DNA-binding protein [Gordonia alkanivorans]
MSASGRRNPLDRLGPVVEPPARRDLSPAAAESDPPPGVGDPGAAVAVEEPAHPGWGIGGMPTWLDAPPSPSPPRRGRVGRFDDVLDPDADSPGGDWDEDDDPVARRRFAVAPPAAIALIAVGVIACVVAGFGLFRGTDTTPVVDFGAPGPSSTSEVSAPTAAQPSTTPAQLVVSVVGLVNKPGLVRLAPGARVAEAIEQAGGARKGADLLSLNLAQVLRDGDQVLVGYAGGEGQMSMRSAVVGAEGAAPAPGPSAGPGSPPPASSAAEAGGRVNLNTATETELDALPGVGPVTAKAILDWRERNGRFMSVGQLAEVDGIGPARLARLRDLVTV